MKNHRTLAKLVYTSMAFSLLTSFTVLGCSPQATPAPTATPTQKPTVTATVAPKPTPTPTASGQPQYGGILRMAQRTEADSLGYPAKMVISFAVPEVAPAVEPLFRLNTSGDVTPVLATAYTANVTAKTITLTVRKGVKFQDGTDFNAAAVQWNLNQFITAKSATTNLIGSMDVVDDYTIRLNLSAWDSTMIGNFALNAGMMVSPTACQTNGIDWSVKHPVGTGAFKFVSWNPGVGISYTRSDGYWQQGKPYLDGVQVVFIVDDLTREVSLRAGEADTAISLLAINLPKLKSDGLVVATRPSAQGAQGSIPDAANPSSPFADIRVRQAVAYALDNAPLIKAVYGDYGSVATNQMTWPGNYAYNPSIVGYPYNPDKAKQLLTAAGYPNGFKTRIVANSGGPQSTLYATGVQSYLKAVGIDATIDILSTAQIAEFSLNGKTWTGLTLPRWSGYVDWVAEMSTKYIGKGSYVSMLVPDDWSQAINNAVSAPDAATKQKFAQQAMQLLIDKYCLFIPYYSSVDNHVMWPYVHSAGIYETNIYIWTPENAWLGGK